MELTDIIRSKDRVIARNVSPADYEALYAEQFCEYVEGEVITLSPIHQHHYWISVYLGNLLRTYLRLKGNGKLREAPFTMRLSKTLQREPDLQVILDAKLSKLQPTYMDGAADICIEVVSPATASVDRGEKFDEYERAGVQEYWLFDPDRNTAMFYRLNASKKYIQELPDSSGEYHTPLLPDFVLHIADLWLDEDALPDIGQIYAQVRAMLGLPDKEE